MSSSRTMFRLKDGKINDIYIEAHVLLMEADDICEEVRSCVLCYPRQHGCLRRVCAVQIVDDIFEEGDRASSDALYKAIDDYLKTAKHATRRPRSIKEAHEYYDGCLKLLEFMKGQLEAARRKRDETTFY